MIVFFCLKDAPSENFLGAQEEHQPGRLGEVIADNLCMRDEFFVLLRDASRNQLLFTGTGRKMRSCECRQDGHFFFWPEFRAMFAGWQLCALLTSWEQTDQEKV